MADYVMIEDIFESTDYMQILRDNMMERIR